MNIAHQTKKGVDTINYGNLQPKAQKVLRLARNLQELEKRIALYNHLLYVAVNSYNAERLAGFRQKVLSAGKDFCTRCNTIENPNRLQLIYVDSCQAGETCLHHEKIVFNACAKCYIARTELAERQFPRQEDEYYHCYRAKKVGNKIFILRNHAWVPLCVHALDVTISEAPRHIIKRYEKTWDIPPEISLTRDGLGKPHVHIDGM
jgi:hypothetical protein